MYRHKFFKFSEDKLEYVPVNTGIRERIKMFFPSFIVGIIVCSGIITGLSFIVDTPGEVLLKNTNKMLMADLSRIESEIKDLKVNVTQLCYKDDSLYRTMLGMEPLPEEMQTAGYGGSKNVISDNGFPNTEITGEMLDEINALKSKLKVVDYSMNQVASAAKMNAEKMRHIPAIVPVSNRDLERLGSGFGMRMHPILRILRMHKGQDFTAEIGTPVFATADGKIKEAYISKTFGEVVIIDHGYGYETLYAHLHDIKVKPGQNVVRGDTVGSVGNSGLSTGCHLHYEVHYKGKAVNPAHYFYADLTPEEYEKVLALSRRNIMSMD